MFLNFLSILKMSLRVALVYLLLLIYALPLLRKVIIYFPNNSYLVFHYFVIPCNATMNIFIHVSLSTSKNKSLWGSYSQILRTPQELTFEKARNFKNI